MATITKTVTVTWEIQWLRRRFSPYTLAFRNIRERIGDPAPHCCAWCDTPFSLDDALALVAVKGDCNKMLCQGCADLVERAQNLRGVGDHSAGLVCDDVVDDRNARTTRFECFGCGRALQKGESCCCSIQGRTVS